MGTNNRVFLLILLLAIIYLYMCFANNNKKNITKKQAYVIGKKLGIDFNRISVDTFRKAMQVELEHGTAYPLTNVTDDDLLITGKITLTHLLEFPDYYQRLEIMEKQGDDYWKNKNKQILT